MIPSSTKILGLTRVDTWMWCAWVHVCLTLLIMYRVVYKKQLDFASKIYTWLSLCIFNMTQDSEMGCNLVLNCQWPTNYKNGWSLYQKFYTLGKISFLKTNFPKCIFA